jgi:hypothetical protein
VEQVEPKVNAYVTRHNLPLVLLGSDYAVGHYRKINTYHDLLEDDCLVDPHSLSIDDVLALGWERIATRIERSRREKVERYLSERNTVRGIRAVLPAVAEGRAEVLFVNPDRAIYGTYDADRQQVALSEPDARDNSACNLVNLAVIFALIYETGIVTVTDYDEIEPPATILY